MATRKDRRRRERPPSPTVEYRDAAGGVLTLRQSLSPGTIAKVAEVSTAGGVSLEDAWRRRTELLFERLAVRWEIAGLPLEGQKMLLGRYRMADSETQDWVRKTLAAHVERYIPELRGP
jgi:hypothetical protein